MDIDTALIMVTCANVEVGDIGKTPSLGLGFSIW